MDTMIDGLKYVPVFMKENIGLSIACTVVVVVLLVANHYMD